MIVRENEQQDISNLAYMLSDKNVLITNTLNEGSIGHDLAYVIRHYAETTFCSDPGYKMSQDSENYREIENGRAYLIKAEDKTEAYDTIRKLNKRVDITIDCQ